MSKLARRHSVAMANKGYIFHTSNPSSFYLKGVRWSTWGENVGVTGGTIGGIEQAFMKSPHHRANILNRRFHRVALGTYVTPTAISGSRSSSTAEPNRSSRLNRRTPAPVQGSGVPSGLKSSGRHVVEELTELLDLLFLFAGDQIAASSRTSSLAKIGTANRTARAIASEGRELTS